MNRFCTFIANTTLFLFFTKLKYSGNWESIECVKKHLNVSVEINIWINFLEIFLRKKHIREFLHKKYERYENNEWKSKEKSMYVMMAHLILHDFSQSKEKGGRS